MKRQSTVAPRARKVYLLIRGDDLGKGMSRYLVDRIMDAENIELLANTEVRELIGEDRLDGIVVEDNRSGARRPLGTRRLSRWAALRDQSLIALPVAKRR